ncbi:MAG: protein translocase subunit SecD, partial [Rhodobacteraceae bacterium]|nr:protein translocase subunit SecD [Paracoccaceae bacterium]
MLQIPLWKRIVILGLCALGLIGAAPNLFYDRVERHNDAVAAVERTGVETAEQTAAIADWPSWLPSAIVNLGLDLRGGAHLLAEVQVEDVYKQRMDAMWPEVRRALVSEAKVAVRRIKGADSELRVEIDKPEAMEKAVEVVRGFASPVVTLTGVGQNDLDIRTEGNQIIVTLSEAEQVATDDRTMQQSLEIVRRRVDAAGTREPTIQRQGQDRILIEVPGIGSAAELKELIGTTAQLTFNQVIRRTSNPEEPAGIGNVNYPSAEEEGAYYILDELPVVTGEELVDARPDFDQNG